MAYPRSRLFRNYEAQLCSEQKSYPRSRLFQVYESSKTMERMQRDEQVDHTEQVQKISISVQELFGSVSNVQENVQEKVTKAQDKIDFDDEEELDFDISKLNY